TIVASDWTGLTSGTLLHAIDKDQNRAVVTAGIVMTNTGTSGQRWTTTEDCGVWTAAVANTTFFMEGSTGGTDHTWTTPATETPCGGSYHLYCFQQ
ncbi:MAG TPA: hypothetical protein VIF15_12220, partial [Polyangiaceae bacterium]